MWHKPLQAIGALLALQQIQIPASPRGFGTATAEVVQDAAGVLPPANVERINRLAFDVHAKSRGEIAVVTLSDLGGRAPEEIALRIGREWGIGAQGAAGEAQRNAGTLILIVPKETSSDGRGYCRVETGRGVEGFITDSRAASMCREANPYFRQRDYGAATELIVTRVAQRYAEEFGFRLESSPSPAAGVPIGSTPPPDARRRGGIPPFFIVVIIWIIISMIGSAGRRGRRRRSGCGGPGMIFIPPIGGGGFGRSAGWGGGGSWGGGGGGGFGGFGGGGGFSGGGGGSSW